MSDCWERGDPPPLAEQASRMHRSAHRVIRAGPLTARPGTCPCRGRRRR
ncbi:hypothetical protein [Streptomyces sp. NPDC003635]